MEHKAGDKVRIINGVGIGREGVIHFVAKDSCPYAVDFGEELSFTHRCGIGGHSLLKSTGYWYREGNIELIKKEVTMEIPKVYKALVRTKDGRLVSIWAENLLEYQEWGITYAPKGSMGIFIKTSLEGAKYNGKSNSKRRCEELNGTLVVHEATPLGNLCSKAGSNLFFFDDRYPAILLGKEVWRDEPKEPTELEHLCEARVLLGGDIRTCARTSLTFCPEGRKYALYFNPKETLQWSLYEGNRDKVAHVGTLQEVVAFVEQDKPKEEPRPEPKFKVGDNLKGVSSFATDALFTVRKIIWATEEAGFGGRPRYLYNDNVGGWNYDEDMLELAPPKEEWVDVTKECTTEIRATSWKGGGYFVAIKHNGKNMLSVGIQGEHFTAPTDYKVETIAATNPSFTYFKVLKKVVK